MAQLEQHNDALNNDLRTIDTAVNQGLMNQAVCNNATEIAKDNSPSLQTIRSNCKSILLRLNTQLTDLNGALQRSQANLSTAMAAQKRDQDLMQPGQVLADNLFPEDW